MRFISAKGLSLSALGAILLLPVAFTQQAFAQDDEDEVTLEEIITIGTRRDSRSAGDSPAPVDVITSSELLNQGDTDLSNVLRTSVPSYNVNSQPISDAATIVRPANLRGLAPDSTLVLINGKRRHRAAVISFLGGGISDGSQGPDISAIPSIAIKQMEVLRDGAASQYGSDAIAGVINFNLRDNSEGGAFEAQWGETYEGDGAQNKVAGNIGFPLGDGGFISLSGQYTEADATSRSVQRADAATLISNGNTAVANPAQIWGQPNVKGDTAIFFNIGIPLAEGIELYSFGNQSKREVEGGFYFRNPTDRDGVYTGPLVNPANGNSVIRDDNGTPDDESDDTFTDSRTSDPVATPSPSVLVGNLAGVDANACPSGIPLTAVNGVTANQAVEDQVFNDPNCFAFTEAGASTNGASLPGRGGFTPRFGGLLEDSALTMGIRGDFNLGTGLGYDFSIGLGESDVEFFINNTINASLGPKTPRSFRPGGYRQKDTNFNADFSYAFPVASFASDLNVAFGYEDRKEEFTITAGDPASFAIGPLAAPTSAFPSGQGFSSSSNGFGGFTPASAGARSQKNDAIYIDAEADVTDQLVLQVAVRQEDFDSFGDTTNYKVGGLYKVNEDLSLRSTFSTGFHAPTAGQANVTNVTTAFSGDMLVDQGTIPLSSVAGQFIADFIVAQGGTRPTLGPEESDNITLGAAFSLGNFDITVDYFNIAVDNRISISDQQDFVAALRTTADNNSVAFSDSDSTSQLLNLLDGAGVLNAADFQGSEDLTSFGFFNNAFDTETQGLDIVANTTLDLRPNGDTSVAVAVNWTDTEVTRGTLVDGTGTLSFTRQRQLEENIPSVRGNVTLNHNEGPWRGLARLNYFGSFFECHVDAVGTDALGTCDLPVDGDSEVTVDLEGAYRFGSNDNYEVIVGARNAFDSNAHDNPFATVVGSRYLPTSPNGFNGGSYYLKIRADF